MGLALVVDDDPMSVRAVSTVLRHAGWDVAGLSDPRQVLEACRRERPTVVLTDLVMPHLDGRELIELLRRELTAPLPGFVLVSGAEDREAIGRAIQVATVAKPYLPGELLDAVATSLGQPERALIAASLPSPQPSPPRGEGESA